MPRMAYFIMVSALTLLTVGPAGAGNALDDIKKAVEGATSTKTETETTKTKETTKTAEPASSSSNLGADLSDGDVNAGLIDALKVGTERVLGQVGTADGFNLDENIHIPLPKSMRQAQDYMRKFGLSEMADDVELKLNRAAEEAAPKTQEIFLNAINAMSFEDARAILNGPDDAATQYFQRTTTADLRDVIRPIVDKSLQDVGAIKAYDSLVGEYSEIPLAPDIKADLTEHATVKSIKGIFYYIGKEEAAIRNNPAARTTDILSKVFGS